MFCQFPSQIDATPVSQHRQLQSNFFVIAKTWMGITVSGLLLLQTCRSDP